ncbi:hemolysin type calcium-binding protein [Rhodobacter aestuarii]|uniref:Hemolysin-type calcium-binding repeat-containing protein n=1 Tax=Rhodobacter aestuarii TaxID=453582 RepID=A0A1N7MAK3_9RHOB|nr:hypothetical protein [Rhodobacter aestuarii]PTV94955.1 hemolysin type calcium-binding protein [Rhodobacter aestuarii]SIS83083.1 Hemolysin-type calcium-binding repeat-containing protein [Rhodobacter aestuarii]
MAVLNGDAFDNMLIGSAADDILYGLDGNDTLNGGAGDDLLFGGDGDDILHFGNGDDILKGGSGSDIFQLWGDAENTHTLITDFTEDDRLSLRTTDCYNADCPDFSRKPHQQTMEDHQCVAWGPCGVFALPHGRHGSDAHENVGSI